MDILKNLKWLAEYGFIDIFFGFGVLGFVYELMHRVFPRNLDELHIDADFVDRNGPLLFIQISNAGGKNIYISKAYFKPKQNSYLPFCKNYGIDFKVRENFKSLSHDYYELRFEPNMTCYDKLIKPGYENKASTGLSLNNLPSNDDRGKGRYGKIVLEYATYGKQGKHVTKV